MRALISALLNEIDDAGGFWPWLTDGMALLALWAVIVALVFLIDAVSTPVPQ